jgi:2,3-diketo-5-methylthio-1-phosphopentane phosphatase
MKSKFHIFVDFDGTIALNDVGDRLFANFARPGWTTPIELWKQGKINSKECLIQECAITKITKKQLEIFSDNQKIDPFFPEFVKYFETSHHPVTVLSDGLTFYIKRILDRYGLGDIPVYANELVFMDTDSIKPEFPYYEYGCLKCGNCKGYHIRKLRQIDQKIIYIGDGFSDRCGVDESDIIFAKDDLKLYCQQNDLNFYEYENFKDVLKNLKEIDEKI